MRLSVIESLLLLAWINKIHNMGDIDLFFEAFTYEDVEIRRKVILASRHISDELYLYFLSR
jgi:hypothetical protein